MNRRPGGAARDCTTPPGRHTVAWAPAAAAIVLPSALTATPLTGPSTRPTVARWKPGRVQRCTQPVAVAATIVRPSAAVVTADTGPRAWTNRCTCGSDCTVANSAARVCGLPGSSW